MNAALAGSLCVEAIHHPQRRGRRQRHIRSAGEHQPAGEFHNQPELRRHQCLSQLAAELHPAAAASNFGSGLTVNQANVANALSGSSTPPAAFRWYSRTLTPAGLTQASGELATGSQQTTFDAMNLFLGLLTDPFIAGRADPISGSAGLLPFGEENDSANAYAANDKARTGASATPMLRSIARRP